MARQLYDYWFVQFDFPDKNGRPYKSSGGKMFWNEKLKREIPEGWSNTNIENYAEVVNGATPSTAEPLNYGGEIIWITPKDLSDQAQKFVFNGERSITKLGYDSCSTSMLPKGTVLMSSRAPIGLLAIASVPLCTNQGFKSFVPKNEDCGPFLYYLINENLPYIKQLGTGTTFSEVSREDINKLHLLLIPEIIINQWNKVISGIFNKQEELIKEIENLIEVRNTLLPLLMNGQVSVKQTEINCDL